MKDQRVEQWLDSYKIPWEYVDALPIAAITIDRDAKENIRLTERLDDDLVVRYGVALENKAEFPGIIVYPIQDRTGATRYGLINGWHRTEAYKLAERSTIPAYVASVTDKLIISVLRRTANTLEGKPPTMLEMLEHAVYLVRQGYTVTDAARLMSVPGKRLNDRVLLDTTRARLASLGVDLNELAIPATGAARLQALRDAHIKPVALLAHAARLTHDKVTELVRQVREADSDEAANAVIRDWQQLYAEQVQRSRGGVVRDPASPIRRLPTMLKQAERLMAVNRDKVHALRREEVKSLITVCRRAIAELQAMVERLEEVHANVN